LGRHSKSGADKWGRFSWITLRGKNSKKLYVVTAYRVCQANGTTPSSRESTTAHWQQVKAMIKQGYRDPDPRIQVLTDMSKMIAAKHQEGCEIIVMIDVNESIEKTRSKWGDFIGKHSLHDVHEVVCGEVPPTTRLGSKT